MANRYGGSHAAHRGVQGASRKKKEVKVLAKEVKVSHLFAFVRLDLDR